MSLGIAFEVLPTYTINGHQYHSIHIFTLVTSVMLVGSILFLELSLSLLFMLVDIPSDG